jgi:haloalkane dehalogenase
MSQIKTIGLLLLFSLIIGSCTTVNKNEQIDSTVFYTTDNYHFMEVAQGLRIAYLDLNPTGKKTILLMHGEPNYSFVYRNIAPSLCQAGYRVVIPDLVGFGHSDKPQNPDLITYTNHTLWVSSFIQHLNLKDIRLFAHDWGAMIALRIVAQKPQLFEKVAISYGYLFDGSVQLPESFLGFRDYATSETNFSAGNIMDWGTATALADSIKKKYDEPFKTASDYYAVRKFPSLIPDIPDDEEALINKELLAKLMTFDKDFITIWGNHQDPMWTGKDTVLQKLIPGAINQKHFTLESNHFIQEDQPTQLTEILLEFFN